MLKTGEVGVFLLAERIFHIVFSTESRDKHVFTYSKKAEWIRSMLVTKIQYGNA